jgi:hypothetical protein
MNEHNRATADVVAGMYAKTLNKILFLQIFGTTRFHLQNDETLTRMYKYLQSKNK